MPNLAAQAMQHDSARALSCFKLPPRHAITLTISRLGELRTAHWQVWLTVADAAQDASRVPRLWSFGTGRGLHPDAQAAHVITP